MRQRWTITIEADHPEDAERALDRVRNKLFLSMIAIYGIPNTTLDYRKEFVHED